MLRKEIASLNTKTSAFFLRGQFFFLMLDNLNYQNKLFIADGTSLLIFFQRLHIRLVERDW